MRHGHNRMQSTSIVIFLNRELSKMFVRAVPLRLSWHAYSNWEPFVFCPRCENVSAFTWMFLNKTSATNWPVFHLHEYLKYFSPLHLSCSYTVLQVIMLISKRGKEAALGIYAYSHCLHLLFISCICFSGEEIWFALFWYKVLHLYLFSEQCLHFLSLLYLNKWRKSEHLPFRR